MRKLGATDDEIRGRLVKKGWPKAAIDDAFFKTDGFL